MADTKAKKGSKIEGAAASKLDPAKMGVLVAKPTDPEVEGQALVLQYLECPWCSNIGRTVIDTERYHYYTCGNCGNLLKA
jgi:hypothetical protein